MCRVDAADGPNEFATTSHPKARREHICGECRRSIRVGQHYERSVIKFDGDVSSHKTCLHCAAVRSFLRVECRGWIYREVQDEMKEHWGHGSEYHSVWLARAIVGMRRKWTRRDGALMEIPGEYVRRERAA